jgi:hypothetical protein
MVLPRRLRLSLLAATAALLAAPAATGQVYAMHFKDQKHAKGYKKHLYELNGESVVLVEVRGGLERNATGGFTWPENGRVEFYVQDQGDPEKLPYKLDEEGNKVSDNKSLTIGISGDRLKGLSPFMASESFYTLSKTYRRKMDVIDALETRRDEAEKGGTAWMAAQTSISQELTLLQVWLRQTGYLKAANKIDRDLLRARKLAKEAKDSRAARARESLKTIKIDPKLKEVAERLGGKDLKFSAQESQHLRIIHYDGIEDGQVTSLLELGEAAVEDFRNRHVDPHLSEAFKDTIPDAGIIEWFFLPDDGMMQEHFWTDYYGYGWGPEARKREALQSRGTGIMRGKEYISYWRTDEASDLENIITHTLGHQLARWHYGIVNDTADWLEEGAGYEMSFRMLGRNNVTCRAFRPPPPKPEGTVSTGPGRKKNETKTETRTVMRGLQETMAGVALASPVPFNRLAPKRLYDFANEDMAKSWAFYTFLIGEGDIKGETWLRKVAKASQAPASFQNKLREITTEVYGYQGDSLGELEETWKAWLGGTYGL